MQLGQAAIVPLPRPYEMEGDLLEYSSRAALHQFSTSLGNTVDAKDAGTYNHSQEVAHIGQALARALGMSLPEIEAVHLAGHLHDIGKIGIPDAILNKQGVLTEDEWEWVRKHPEMGAKIIQPVCAFNAMGITEIVLSHHERFDGRGYPHGLKGSSIPLGARIVAVADTLSALLEDRPYRRGIPFQEALEEVRRCSGSQFDPMVVAGLETGLPEVKNLFTKSK